MLLNNCPICENSFKTFDFQEQGKITEEIRQCRDCSLTIRNQYNILSFSLKDNFVKIVYNEENFDIFKERKRLKRINYLINKERKKLKKSRIIFFPRLKKVCSFCGRLKPIFEFHANKNTKDGRTAYCKQCSKKSYKNYSYTFEGWLSNAYHTLKIHQKKRFNSDLLYTKEDLRAWINMDLFDNLFDNYLKSGYKKSFSVCLYRKDYKKNYSLDNLQIISFEMLTKDVRRKINYQQINEELFARPIAQYHNGKILKIFSSIRKAERETGCDASSIVKVCKGKYRIHHGFEWKYL